MIEGIREWWSADRRGALLDVLLAVVVGVVALVTMYLADPEPPLGAIGLIVVQSAALTVRRRWPLGVYSIVGTGTVAYAWLGYPATAAGLGVLLAIYTVAAHEPLREAVVAGGIYVVGMTLSLVGFAMRDSVIRLEELIAEFVVNVLVLVLAWTVGVTIRTRRAYVDALETRNRILEREREENARLAVALERGRIAREMHDVVAHSVSVVVVQAAAAERMVEKDPGRAREALREIAETGRGALTEMRRLLGVLREEEDGDGLAPQPGIAELPALVATVQEAGLPVELSVQGEERPLPPSAALSAYRIVQEALTNALRHAGPARARVIVRYLPDTLEVQVSDNGSGGAAHGPGGDEAATGRGGHGLIGMQERVALFGGELQAGPRSEGGYSVLARIPTAALDA